MAEKKCLFETVHRNASSYIELDGLPDGEEVQSTLTDIYSSLQSILGIPISFSKDLDEALQHNYIVHRKSGTNENKHKLVETLYTFWITLGNVFDTEGATALENLEIIDSRPSATRIGLLKRLTTNFRQLKGILGTNFKSFMEGRLVFENRIEESGYSLGIRKGTHPETYCGIEFFLRNKDIDRLATVGFLLNEDAIDILNIQGPGPLIPTVERKKIKRNMLHSLKIGPFHALVLLISMWAKENGFPQINGIHPLRHPYFDTADFSKLYYDTYKKTGLTLSDNENGYSLNVKDFYTKGLGSLTRKQNEGFDNICKAFMRSSAVNDNLETIHSPFTLDTFSAEVLTDLITTTRYAIGNKHSD